MRLFSFPIVDFSSFLFYILIFIQFVTYELLVFQIQIRAVSVDLIQSEEQGSWKVMKPVQNCSLRLIGLIYELRERSGRKWKTSLGKLVRLQQHEMTCQTMQLDHGFSTSENSAVKECIHAVITSTSRVLGVIEL